MSRISFLHLVDSKEGRVRIGFVQARLCSKCQRFQPVKQVVFELCRDNKVGACTKTVRDGQCYCTEELELEQEVQLWNAVDNHTYRTRRKCNIEEGELAKIEGPCGDNATKATCESVQQDDSDRVPALW